MSKSPVFQGSKPIPHFDSVDEESEFWATRSPLDYGTWWEVTPEDLEQVRRPQDMRDCHIQIDLTLLERLESIAAHYHTDINTLIRAALWRYARAAE